MVDFMVASSTFHPAQILCIDHKAMCLFVEVIQIAEARPLCWVRPLFLTMSLDFGQMSDSLTAGIENSQGNIQDLREGVDLLLPIQLFRPALDTEVIPLLALLKEPKADPGNGQTAHQHLQEFTQSLWRTHPEAFLTS